jgi:PAS domain S-box-containing protein
MTRQEQTISVEQFRAIVEQTPNGVLMVDRETRIRYVNESFKVMFHCSDEELIGQPAVKYIHCDCFERSIAQGGRLIVKETIPEHGISFRLGMFPIEGDGLYCGIFIDITLEEEVRQHYRELKAQTLQRAQEVISKEMQTAQEIARLLGETTAETKVILVKLMSLFQEEHEP